MTMNKKGFILIVVAIFLVVAAITALGLYNSVYFVSKTQGIDEVKRIRGYYAASSGLSYANVILMNPVTGTLTKNLKTDNPQLWQDLGLNDPEDVVIVIIESKNGNNVTIGFSITSTFVGKTGQIKVTGFTPKFGFPKTGADPTHYAGYTPVSGEDMGTIGTPASGGLPHYQDNGDGTITDNATGLMWVQNPCLCTDENGAPWVYMGGGEPLESTWAEAITRCEGLVYAGYDDWRLPNINELMSIVEYGKRTPAVDPIFRLDLNKPYWSSTTSAQNAGYAYIVFFNFGGSGPFDKSLGWSIITLPVRDSR